MKKYVGGLCNRFLEELVANLLRFQIDERVAKLIDSKKQSQGSSQVQGHLQADAAAIAGTSTTISAQFAARFAALFISKTVSNNTLSPSILHSCQVCSYFPCSRPFFNAHFFGRSRTVRFSPSEHFCTLRPLALTLTRFDLYRIVTYSENLPPGLPDVIEDRLSILEKKLYSNLAGTTSLQASQFRFQLKRLLNPQMKTSADNFLFESASRPSRRLW